MENVEIATKKRGGYRANSGRKKKYGEETKIVTFRFPASMHKELKKSISKLLSTTEKMKQFIHQMDMTND